MDRRQIDVAKKHLKEINTTVASLDPAIRAGAFEILVPLYFEPHGLPRDAQVVRKDRTKPKDSSLEQAGASREQFFSRHEHTKPADNVALIAAWLYSQHGVIPITTTLCRTIADGVGVTIPNRPDNTMRQAREKGKSLFRQLGKGWALTTHGELHMKNTYGVRKGNKPVPEDDDT